MKRFFTTQKFSYVCCLMGLLALTACGNQAPPQTATDQSADSNRMSVEELMAMPKIDAHAHVTGVEGDVESSFFQVLKQHNIKWLTITTGGMNPEGLNRQIVSSIRLMPLHSSQLAWATSFQLATWNEPGWTEQALNTIIEGFDNGAVAVKVWKDIGMVLRDTDSSFVMIDNPKFEPIFDLIESSNKTLLAHIGEPRNCWLPLEAMTVNNDRAYFAENPQYHSYLHPEIPDYWEHVHARDSVLARHPDLRVVGAHLGSLEWDVDSLARRFDLYPNFAVDLSARICHFQVQDRSKVRDFIIKYQDRLLYGTDLGINPGWKKFDLDAILQRITNTYNRDYRYFATDEEMEVPEVDGTFRGLALPSEVLEKVFRENALRWFPGIGTADGS